MTILREDTILVETEGMNQKELVVYLKQYKARELSTIANSMGCYCHKKETKIIALQKVVQCIVDSRGSGL